MRAVMASKLLSSGIAKIAMPIIVNPYLPDGMAVQRFYAPTKRGLEAKIRDKLAYLRARDRAVDDAPD